MRNLRRLAMNYLVKRGECLAGNYIDIHSHTLWDIDDGSVDIYETLDMCGIASETGTSTLFLTPHLMYWESSDELLEERDIKYEQLCEIIEEYEMPLKLKTGFEVLCDDDIFTIKNFERYTLCNSRYILIEFDFFKTTEEDVSTWCTYLMSTGVVPVIAHPERYRFMLADGGCLDRLSDMGVLFQINAGSAAGMFGGASAEFACRMINTGFADFVGSDAHDVDFRNTDMDFCFMNYPEEVDEQLLIKAATENPQFILENKLYIPDRLGLFEEI